MRPYIIVTVQTDNKDFVYDIEVPTNVPAGRLGSDILEALNAHDQIISTLALKGSLFCKRLSMTIPEDMTFLEIGVWSGDVIVIF